MRRAGKVVAEMHEATRAAAKPGVTTAELDQVAREVLERRGATSNFLGYHGFPAVICTSPNSMIVHGIPGRLRARGGGHPLHRLRGHHRGLPRRRRLHHGHRDHLQGGPEAARGDRAQPVGRDRADDQGQRPPRDRPGRPEGGRGRRLQRGPRVRGPRHRDRHARAAPGPQLLARQPGARRSRRATSSPSSPWSTRARPRPCCSTTSWSVVTADGSLSAHFEHTIAVTPDGPEVLHPP